MGGFREPIAVLFIRELAIRIGRGLLLGSIYDAALFINDIVTLLSLGAFCKEHLQLVDRDFSYISQGVNYRLQDEFVDGHLLDPSLVAYFHPEPHEDEGSETSAAGDRNIAGLGKGVQQNVDEEHHFVTVLDYEVNSVVLHDQRDALPAVKDAIVTVQFFCHVVYCLGCIKDRLVLLHLPRVVLFGSCDAALGGTFAVLFEFENPRALGFSAFCFHIHGCVF